MVEMLIHHYTLEFKEQSKQCREPGFSSPKKTRSVPPAGNIMASMFWDAEDILVIDYLEKCKTITGEYYSNLLTGLDEKYVRKTRIAKNIIFYQVNAPAHKSVLKWEN
jgi:hypothetical protein